MGRPLRLPSFSRLLHSPILLCNNCDMTIYYTKSYCRARPPTGVRCDLINVDSPSACGSGSEHVHEHEAEVHQPVKGVSYYGYKVRIKLRRRQGS